MDSVDTMAELPHEASPAADPAPDPDIDPSIRPAATVLLVRDGAAGIETFVLRRVAALAFAAG